MAGLAAARALSGAGLTVRVLEARERIGGRVFTRRWPGLPAVIELGAEFVHGLAPETLAIAQTAALGVVEMTGETWLARNGSLEPFPDLFDQIDEVMERLAMLGDRDVSFQEFLDTCCPEERLREAKALARAWIEGYDAAHVDRISALSVARDQVADAEIHGERGFRLLDGYAGVAEWLRAGLAPDRAALHLNTVVREVRWQRGQVEIVACSQPGGAESQFTAPRAVVTLPLGVLKAPPGAPGAVRFAPQPEAIAAAAQRLEMGGVVKCALVFRERFWEQIPLPGSHTGHGLARLRFLRAPGEPFPTWWTTYPVLAPLLLGWASGPAADALTGLGEPALLDRALESLARAFGLGRADLERLLHGWLVHDWLADPFARGAYSYVGVGGLAAQRALAQPVEGTLFFAGEASDYSGHYATVHGAIRSGRRAAEQVLASRM